VVSILSTLFERRPSRQLPKAAEWLSLLCVIGFFAAVARLALDPVWAGAPFRKAISSGIFVSALLIVVAFLLNRNIFNSDNYRYLVYLITVWSLGFGLLMSDISEKSLPGRAAAFIFVAMLIGLMTSSTITWYRDLLGYLNSRWQVVR